MLRDLIAMCDNLAETLDLVVVGIFSAKPR
jgi:hypothetical protein